MAKSQISIRQTDKWKPIPTVSNSWRIHPCQGTSDFLAISLVGAAFHKRCGGGPTLGGLGNASWTSKTQCHTNAVFCATCHGVNDDVWRCVTAKGMCLPSLGTTASTRSDPRVYWGKDKRDNSWRDLALAPKVHAELFLAREIFFRNCAFCAWLFPRKAFGNPESILRAQHCVRNAEPKNNVGNHSFCKVAHTQIWISLGSLLFCIYVFRG